jgi:bifunctional non-homologous end joining protein LigD
VLLPHLRDRPVHLNRFPDGIDGKSFYQREAKAGTPAWVRTVPIEHDGAPVPHHVVDDLETLLYVVNLGSIDLHPWLSRVDAPEMPDFAIVDLDPSDDDFGKPLRIARTVGKILTGAGLRPRLKTSGKTGIHIYIPLVPARYTYEQARMFCEVVARMAVVEHKKIATVERSPAKRGDKVYVDFGQNRREQTVVPPYVVRPVPGATVSAPLDWDELSQEIHPRDFDMTTVPERLERLGDLFRGALADPQELEPAIEALGRGRAAS